MTNKRIKYSDSQQTALVLQVNRVCPLCAEPLYNKKNGRSYKQYELAHIYPLNPTLFERDLLKDVELLSHDPNAEDNIIPLCKTCHGKFDNPRTLDGYLRLFALKNELIEKSGQEEIWKQYRIEDEINTVIQALYDSDEIDSLAEIQFKPKKVDDKLTEEVTSPTRRKIKNNVQDYYVFIRDKLKSLDQDGCNKSQVISHQIKAFYLVQTSRSRNQQAIFENIVAWVEAITTSKSRDAAEIITSFFIQNCEVFE